MKTISSNNRKTARKIRLNKVDIKLRNTRKIRRNKKEEKMGITRTLLEYDCVALKSERSSEINHGYLLYSTPALYLPGEFKSNYTTDFEQVLRWADEVKNFKYVKVTSTTRVVIREPGETTISMEYETFTLDELLRMKSVINK